MAGKRRARGTGSVKPFGPDGDRWRAFVSFTDPGSGKRLKPSKVFPPGTPKAVAEAWVRDQLTAGPRAEGTVEAWVEEWYANHRRTTEPATHRRDREVIDRYILPRLGRLKLPAVDARSVGRWVTALEEDGAPPEQVRRSFAVLKNLLRAHPSLPGDLLRRVKLRRVKRAETRHLNPDELRVLLQTADSWDGWYGAMVRVGVDCGTRVGELLGLTWGDHDRQKGTLTLRRAVCKRTGELKALKTDRSRRTLPLTPPTRAALEGLERGGDAEPIFHRLGGRRWKEGGHLGYGNWYHRHWLPLVKAAGLAGTGVVPKSLRHTCASLLLSAGVNVLVVSRRLGHSTPTLTLAIYGHLMPDDQLRATDVLSTLL